MHPAPPSGMENHPDESQGAATPCRRNSTSSDTSGGTTATAKTSWGSARRTGWDLVHGLANRPSSQIALDVVPEAAGRRCAPSARQRQTHYDQRQTHYDIAKLPRLLNSRFSEANNSWRLYRSWFSGNSDGNMIETEDSLYELQGVAPGFCFLQAGAWPSEMAQHCLRWLAIVNLVWTTFALTFGGPGVFDLSSRGETALVDLTLDTCCTLGLVLRLRTSLVDTMASVEHRGTRRIFVLNLKAPVFWVDTVSLVAMLSYRKQLFFLRAFRLLRTWRLGAWLELGTFDAVADERSKNANLVRLLELVVIVFTLGHLFACVWFAVIFRALGEDAYPDEADGGLSRHVYLFSLRDGLLLLTDSPNAPHQQDPSIVAVTLVLQPFGTMIMAWIFAELVVTLQRLTILSSRQAEHNSLVSAAMTSLHLPTDLRHRIERYQRYLEIHRNPAAYEALFKGLSVNLTVELKRHLYRTMVGDAPFFRDLPTSVLHNLLLGFQEVVHSPGDVIIRKGGRDKEMYFVVRGKVDIIDDDHNLLAAKTSGDYFGEVALILKDMCRTAWARARTFCVVATLDQSRFFAAMDEDSRCKTLMVNRIRSFHNVSSEDLHAKFSVT